MHATDVIGYAFDADIHCEACTRARFPDADAEFSDVTDSEGNEIHPLFASDDHDDNGEYCGDCHAELWEPQPKEPPTFRVGDDGTLDTVIVCNRCGEEMRYNYDGDSELETYDDFVDFVDWALEDAADSHTCDEDGE